MAKKPTTSFGNIAFGKDGSVKANIEKLSDNKAEQEVAVGEKFVGLTPDLFNGAVSISKLEEANHDFNILVDGKIRAEVQCTEIVFRDFLGNEKTETDNWIQIGGEAKPVDIKLRDNVLIQKIENKFQKHYQKPTNSELWLLIWSVTNYLEFGHAYSAGKLVVSEAVLRAQSFLAEIGSGPFDRIYSFNMQTKPTQVWPSP